MPQSSTLTRSRLAVLGVTGITSAYAAYTLYHLYRSNTAQSNLRRSNAVHRHRSQPQASEEATHTNEARMPEEHGGSINFDFHQPTAEAPFGRMHMTTPDTHHTQVTVTLETSLGIEPLPSAVQLFRTFGNDVRALVEVVAVERIVDVVTSMEDDVSLPHLWNINPRSIFCNVVDEVFDPPARMLERLPGLRDVSGSQIREGLRRYGEVLDEEQRAGRTYGQATVANVNPIRPRRPSLHWVDTTEAAEEDKEPSQGIKGLLYFIAEHDATRKAYEHRGIHCDSCGESPIKGARWRCLNCPNLDFCSTCEATVHHPKTHVFSKIKIPLPVLSQPMKQIDSWYPAELNGKPPENYSLGLGARQWLADKYDFGLSQVDALCDQFTCLANVNEERNNEIIRGIDKHAFKRALSSDRWKGPLKPSILYDRMFSFYDTDKDGLISFPEFVSGVAYLRGSKRFDSLERALQGFDHDKDGLVDRSDFLRLLLAKYAVQKLIVVNLVRSNEPEQLGHAMNLIRSSQPISAAFADQDIPLGERRTLGGKRRDSVGDVVPRPGVPTILPDTAPWTANQAQPDLSPRQLQERLSRFEEMLYGSENERDVDMDDPQAQTDGARTDTDEEQVRPARVLDMRKLDHLQHLSGTEDIPPDDQDLLYRIISEGFNEVLHPIFLAKERLAQEVRDTLQERDVHRAEIDAFVAERKKFEEHMCEQAAVDPLMATALRSYQATRTIREENRPYFQPQMLPTDNATLAQAEREILETPLEDLLKETGYSVAEDDQEILRHSHLVTNSGSGGAFAGAEAATGGPPTDASPHDFATVHNNRNSDPTMPQHMPDSSSSNANAVPNASTSTNSLLSRKPLSTSRLQYLSALDLEDAEIMAREGPGKLSLEEVEAIAKADGSGEVKGLITGWLDWASF